ncbi:hypothetical protein MUK42_25431 [Musa troglodytarum]|uniref:Uncharacterized protein n=1 Tax=Musa troglodytarum TaxID=320322 RepID=A0A9E7I1V9_9LILI|nr:hypothetical protein MUK42_25431 [Musa troglodytarum]
MKLSLRVVDITSAFEVSHGSTARISQRRSLREVWPPLSPTGEHYLDEPPLSSSVPFSRIRGIRSDTRFTFYSQRLSILGTESSRILYGYAELMLETTSQHHSSCHPRWSQHLPRQGHRRRIDCELDTQHASHKTDSGKRCVDACWFLPVITNKIALMLCYEIVVFDHFTNMLWTLQGMHQVMLTSIDSAVHALPPHVRHGEHLKVRALMRFCVGLTVL